MSCLHSGAQPKTKEHETQGMPLPHMLSTEADVLEALSKGLGPFAKALKAVRLG